MFTCTRQEAINGLKAVLEGVCAYSMPGMGLAERCDCKYGFRDKREMEQTGCPELRTILLLMDVMSDDTFEFLINAGGGLNMAAVNNLMMKKAGKDPA